MNYIISVICFTIAVICAFFLGMIFKEYGIKKANRRITCSPDFDEQNPINAAYKPENINGHLFYRITPEGQWGNNNVN